MPLTGAERAKRFREKLKQDLKNMMRTRKSKLKKMSEKN